MSIYLYNEDCLETIKRLDKVDLILTDPPYPDYLADEYCYHDKILDFLKNFDCRQLVFWSAKVGFPLDYTAIHIWDKARGVGTMYERVFERNGQKGYKVFRGQKYNNQLDATINRDVLTDHPSQKPIKLISKLLLDNSKEGDLIYDPFTGSGTTAIACVKYKRNFIGSEINTEIYNKTIKRLAEYDKQPVLF
ncbi:MAG: site-specific DNA-methyltransferase [Flavobacteriales bacterium]|nr:site-specific DNA-methyltransferase [Flavobacteriales bacterium]